MNKPDNTFRKLAQHIAEDLNKQAQECPFDDRLHRGGIFYAAATDMQHQDTYLIVPLVLRSTLPPTHPNCRVIKTAFIYHISIHQDECQILQRPDVNALRQFYQTHTLT